MRETDLAKHGIRGLKAPSFPALLIIETLGKNADLTTHFSAASDPGEQVLANHNVANYADYGEAVSHCEEPGPSTKWAVLHPALTIPPNTTQIFTIDLH